jgi:hypothetical protein
VSADRGTQRRVGTLDLVSGHPSGRNLRRHSAGDQRRRQRRFGREFSTVIGYSGGGAAVRVLGPGLGQIQRPVDQGVPARRGVGQIHRHLRVLDPTGGAAVLARKRPFDKHKRDLGLDFPPDAETMIGMQRLTSLQRCVETVLADDVPGGLVECGVWRGGASILMRAVLAVYGDESRSMWLADSFAGVPPPDAANYKADKGIRLDRSAGLLAVSEAEVRANFERYGLLDDQVRFLPGWFKDTLQDAPIDRIAVLRLDGDLYESTIQALDALYPRLSPGGFCIIVTTTRSRRVSKPSRTTSRNMGCPRRLSR